MFKSKVEHVSTTVILYKLISGLIELLMGIGILLYGKNIIRIYDQYRVREMMEDPHDLLIMFTKILVPYIIHHRTYFMLFLIFLGLVKIVGAIGLIKGKTWGLNLLIIFFVVMLPFDLYNLFIGITYFKVVYFIINFFIALYLMGLRPHRYLLRRKKTPIV